MPVRLAAPLISLLTLAAPAEAATVRVELVVPPPNPKFPEPAYETVRYAAAAGETNTVTVSAGPGGDVVFTDASAPLTPGEGCTAGAGGTVVCVRSGVTPYSAVDVRAGDGDDRVSASTPANLFGEAGADVLEATAGAGLDGGDGDDTLTGSPAKESLAGGAGADRLAGGAGEDTLNGDRPAADGAADVTGDDVLDGGEGVDLLNLPRTHDVTVDLSAGTAGGPGERDTITGLERVWTGDGDDRVIGGEGPDQVSTGPGDDAVDGRGGNDVIDGGSGTNALDGGAGDDLLRFTARSCGPGTDVLEGSTVPLAPADCEAIGLDTWMTDIGITVSRAATATTAGARPTRPGSTRSEPRVCSLIAN